MFRHVSCQVIQCIYVRIVYKKQISKICEDCQIVVDNPRRTGPEPVERKNVIQYSAFSPLIELNPT
jgi:hypothetical protein